MITTAIIAEFNPLHSGHEYIIQEAKRITNADCIVVVLSGYFTQRGDIAIAPKHTRAAAAISCGADIVFELPFAFATSSAEFFASGAVSLLNSLKKIDFLVFGAENDDISVLSSAAYIFLDEPEEFKRRLNSCLLSGMSFPAAREQAYISCGGCEGIFTPNNTLAIEYIKALKKLSSDTKPIAIRRVGSGYNDKDYSQKKGYISASAFRAKTEDIVNSSSSVIDTNGSSELDSFLFETLPSSSADIMLSCYNKTFPLFNDDMSMLIYYSVLMHRNNLESFCDFTPALSNRIRRMLDKEGNSLFAGNYEDFILSIKTKEMTAARIKRAMLHLLTGYTNEAHQNAVKYLNEGILPYARILALSPSGQCFISEIKKGCDITLINSLGKSMPLLDDNALRLIHYDILSSDIYASVIKGKFHHTIPDEFRTNVKRIGFLRT